MEKALRPRGDLEGWMVGQEDMEEAVEVGAVAELAMGVAGGSNCLRCTTRIPCSRIGCSDWTLDDLNTMTSKLLLPDPIGPLANMVFQLPQHAPMLFLRSIHTAHTAQ